MSSACENLPPPQLSRKLQQRMSTTICLCHRSERRMIHSCLGASHCLNEMHVSLKETKYARGYLGAVETVLLAKHEGKYFGNPELTPSIS